MAEAPKTEAKKERTLADIQLEYSNTAMRAGALQYEIKVKNDDLKLLNDRLRDLNMEFIAAKNKQAEIDKAVADAKAKEQEAAKPAVEEKKD